MSILPEKSRVVGVGLVELMDFDEERFVFPPLFHSLFVCLSVSFFFKLFSLLCANDEADVVVSTD